eukprot:3258500-Rhodomonas_salina.1
MSITACSGSMTGENNMHRQYDWRNDMMSITRCTGSMISWAGHRSHNIEMSILPAATAKILTDTSLRAGAPLEVG